MPNHSTSKIYNRIQLFRTAHNLSRQELADALSVNFQTIGYLERGDYTPSLELALKMSAYFQIPTQELFSLTPFETIFPINPK